MIRLCLMCYHPHLSPLAFPLRGALKVTLTSFALAVHLARTSTQLARNYSDDWVFNVLIQIVTTVICMIMCCDNSGDADRLSLHTSDIYSYILVNGAK